MRASNRRDFNIYVNILTGTLAYANVVPNIANFQIFVTDLMLSITTHVAGDVYTIDDDGTGSIIAVHTDALAAAGVPSVVHWPFGRYGTPVTVGANVDVSHSSTGVARLQLIGHYQKILV